MTIAQLRPETAPYNAEAEQAVLGAILLGAGSPSRVAALGGVDLFHDPAHGAIFGTIAKKDRAGELVSPVTVAEALRGDPAIDGLGVGYMARLASAAPPQSAFSGYVSLLSEMRRKRDILAAVNEAQASIARGDAKASEIAQRLEAAIIATEDGAPHGPTSMQKAVLDAMHQTQAAYNGEDDGGVRSGIASLDKLLTGFYPGEMTLLGGRPSMGKTALALSIALNVARAGGGVAIASLEMKPAQMALRALSEATGHAGMAVSYKSMRSGEFTDGQRDCLLSVAGGVADLPITFLDTKYRDLGAMAAGFRQIKRAMGSNLRMIIIDYAQLLESKGNSRVEQVTAISMALKGLAMQLDVPVIALSQLSRAVESRDDKRPMLSDLRESGQLEQDADAVMFCYRDAYYVERARPGMDDPVEDHQQWEDAMRAVQNKLEIIVAKNRQGEIGTAHVMCNPAINLIWENW